ncbi:zinc finger, CCHC-type containing protein [Tanacetum coccineum]
MAVAAMSVVFVLTTLIPEDGENAIVEQIRKMAKWDNDDYVCSGLILKDFKRKKQELTLVELGSHLRIEESLRTQDSDKPNGNNVVGPHNQMFMLNIVNDNIASAFMSTSKLNDSILWHARLGHVHFKRMQDMSKDGLIPAFDTDVEKKNRVLKEMVNSMLSYSGLSQGFWGEAMLTASYLLNRAPNKRNKINPYELWTKRKPNLNYLSGCREVVRLPDPKLKTLGERGIKCIFVGYAEHSNAFRFYVIEPNESVLINSIIESKDAIFNENRFSSILRPSLRILNGTKDIGSSVVPKEVTKEVDGTIEKFKTRLVIQGFRKKSWIDYFDTYAPVTRISTIRLLIAMTSIHNLIIHQMDVKTTFLNEEQAPKQWHQKFDEVVLSNGYLLNQANKYVYSKFDESGKGVIICLYIDDMLIFGTDQVQVDLTKEFLSSRFSMKDMGKDDVIYVSTLMDTSEKPMPNNGQAASQLEYSRVIGCLIAATLAKAYSKMYNRKSRHLGVRHSMIRELITNGVISIKFVRSQQNLANHLTKRLARDLVIKSAEGMGLKSNQVIEC